MKKTNSLTTFNELSFDKLKLLLEENGDDTLIKTLLNIGLRLSLNGFVSYLANSENKIDELNAHVELKILRRKFDHESISYIYKYTEDGHNFYLQLLVENIE